MEAARDSVKRGTANDRDADPRRSDPSVEHGTVRQERPVRRLGGRDRGAPNASTTRGSNVDLGNQQSRVVCRLHNLLIELSPGGIAKELNALVTHRTP
jgi:hypothetical protein